MLCWCSCTVHTNLTVPLVERIIDLHVLRKKPIYALNMEHVKTLEGWYYQSTITSLVVQSRQQHQYTHMHT